MMVPPFGPRIVHTLATISTLCIAVVSTVPGSASNTIASQRLATSQNARAHGTIVTIVRSDAGLIVAADKRQTYEVTRRSDGQTVKMANDQIVKIVEVNPDLAIALTNTVLFGPSNDYFDAYDVSTKWLLTHQERDFASYAKALGDYLVKTLSEYSGHFSDPHAELALDEGDLFQVVIALWDNATQRAEYGKVALTVSTTMTGYTFHDNDIRDESDSAWRVYGETRTTEALKYDARFNGLVLADPDMRPLVSPDAPASFPDRIALRGALAIIRLCAEVGPQLDPPITTISPSADAAVISPSGFRWLFHGPLQPTTSVDFLNANGILSKIKSSKFDYLSDAD